jgi:hypothetical protein
MRKIKDNLYLFLALTWFGLSLLAMSMQDDLLFLSDLLLALTFVHVHSLVNGKKTVRFDGGVIEFRSLDELEEIMEAIADEYYERGYEDGQNEYDCDYESECEYYCDCDNY